MEDVKVAELVSCDICGRLAQVIESHVSEPERFGAMSRASITRYRQAFTQEEHLARLKPLVVGSAGVSQPKEEST